ncbi:hypothetical protein [Sphingomonas sp. PB4P5]|uniref:hypothetical protein n=1 Tax=Parasphingomonas puruogangriensis TaxID=3096155 RepID=UPI002FCC2654
MRDYLSLFDLAIAGVPVVIFCIWQLVSVNREIAKDKLRDSPESPSPKGPSPKGPGHAIGEHRLDDR